MHSSSISFDQVGGLTELVTFVRQCLTQDEELVWVGQPDPKSYAQKTLGWNVMSTVLAWIIVLLILGNGVGYWFLCLVPLYLSFAAWNDIRQREREAKQIIYAITNRRLLVINVALDAGPTSYPLQDITNVKVQNKTENIGNVFFIEEVVTQEKGYEFTRYIGFEMIPDMEYVATKICEQAGL